MKIKKYFQFKPEKDKVSLQLKEGSFKLVSLKFIKNEPVFFLTEKKVSSVSWEGMAEELKSVFAAQGLSKQQVFLILPRQLSIVRFLHLPSTDEKEISSMVDTESLKHMPYRIQDVILGYRIIEKQENGYANVLSAATEYIQIKPFLETLEKAGIAPEKITLSSEALLAWYLLLRRKAKISYSDTIALINFDSDYIDIVILEKEKLKFTRGFFYSEAAEEVKKSLLTYERQSSRRLNKIIITGAMSRIEPVLERLNQELDIQPELVPQAEGLAITQEPKPDFRQSSFAGLLGLAMESQEVKINLLPKEMIQRNRLKLLKRDLDKVLTLLFCVVLVLTAVIAKQVWDKSAYLKLLHLKLAAIAPEVAKAKAMRENIRVIRKEIEQRPLAIEVFTEVYKAAPSAIRLNLIDYKNGEFLLVKGNGQSLNEIITFVSSLDESRYFGNVRIRYTAQRKASPAEAVDFEIIADLTSKP